MSNPTQSIGGEEVTAYELAYLPWCKKWEGSCAWFYLDTVGNVTSGVGFELPDGADGLRLPVVYSGPCDPRHGAGDSGRVEPGQGHATGAATPFYAIETALQLRQEDIDAHLLTILDQTG